MYVCIYWFIVSYVAVLSQKEKNIFINITEL